MTDKTKKAVKIANIAGNFLSKKVAPVAEMVALLKVVPGLSTVANIAGLVQQGAKNGGNILTTLTKPDDGTPKSCWIKSALRKFKFGTTCSDGDYEKGTGPVCYKKCPKGNGIGPVCWGKCHATNHKTGCGPLCLLKADKAQCNDVVKAVTMDAISIGVSAGSGDVLGAIMGSLAIASDLVYPICKEFN